MDSCTLIIFYKLQSNTIIISFVSQIVPYLAIGSSFSLRPVFLLACTHRFEQFSILSYNMFHAHLAFALPQPWNQQPLPRGSPIAFMGARYSETKIWALGVFIATGVSLLYISQQTELGSVSVCVFTCVCVSACPCVHMCELSILVFYPFIILDSWLFVPQLLRVLYIGRI